MDLSLSAEERRIPMRMFGGTRRAGCIDAVTFEGATEQFLARAAELPVHLCIAYTVATTTKNSALLPIPFGGDLKSAEGTPPSWMAKRLCLGDMQRRVYGPEFMSAAMDRSQTPGAQYFLHGATFGFVAGTMTQALNWFRKHGPEWVYRLATKPQQLRQRYLLWKTHFVWLNTRVHPRLLVGTPE